MRPLPKRGKVSWLGIATRQSEGRSHPNGEHDSAIFDLLEARIRRPRCVEFSEQVYHVFALCNVAFLSGRIPHMFENRLLTTGNRSKGVSGE
jgi:hypothetical protein